MEGVGMGYERDGAIILKRLDLRSDHPQCKTKHYLPRDSANPYPDFVSLEIARYEDAPGYYLFHITSDGQNSDTYHSSMQEALEHAEFEFGVKPEEWIDVAAG